MSLTPAEAAQIGSQYGGGAILPLGPTVSPLATTPFAQTFDRRLATSAVFSPTTQVLTISAIWLAAGQVVTGITFVSGSTAESGGSHLWYALYKGLGGIGGTTFSLLAQSTDDAGGASFAANTAFRKALTAPQTCTYTGLYYLGFMCQASVTVPTLLNVTAATANGNGSITGMTPNLAATADAALGAVAPATMGSQTAITQCLYAFVD